MHEGSINWKHISEEDFNRVVEALLLRMYHRPPESTAAALDGRGGDGGIDVAVYDETGKIKHIFQLKHFPEGFSGGFRDTRRRQIKESFDAAWTNHAPPVWTLVVPCNPTDKESIYVSGLGKGKEVTPAIWGERLLDIHLARRENRDILDAATRNPLLDALKFIGQENAALAGAGDLSTRLSNLHGLAAGRSLYWDTDFHVSRDGVTEAYRAKHPRAGELEPLGFKFAVKKNAFGVEDIQRVLDYGVRRRVTIPGAAVEGFKTVGPEWFQHEGTVDRIEISPAHPLPADQRISVTLEFLDEDGFTRASHQGMMHAKSDGGRGVAFVARFYGILELDAEIPYALSAPGNFGLNMEFANARVTDAQGVLRLLRDFDSGSVIQVLFEDKKLLKGFTNGGAQLMDPATELLVEDLAVLEDKMNATFRFPVSLTNRQRVMIRVARLLAEGQATWMPPETSLTGILSGEPYAGLNTLLSGSCAITMPIPAFPVEIQGSRFNLGPAVLYHPHTAVRDVDDLKKAFRKGTAAGREVIFAPQGEKLIWVMPGKYEGGERVPDTVPWDLPGIPMPDFGDQELPSGPSALKGLS
ncbi:hypothetical protein LVY72_14110 [Arthrobacter sp. I2-34]|uniref:Restriction endonuclease n=1 Tax=Arthrobacter hankyongi TaxID=2904801 RepID=A0ABS9L8M3_9MICC|nr:hypothetical protein [Arthrobacter hankyongi]MCG2623033.1 hypothetical protein [Arthrobacter hankyongi]